MADDPKKKLSKDDRDSIHSSMIQYVFKLQDQGRDKQANALMKRLGFKSLEDFKIKSQGRGAAPWEAVSDEAWLREAQRIARRGVGLGGAQAAAEEQWDETFGGDEEGEAAKPAKPADAFRDRMKENLDGGADEPALGGGVFGVGLDRARREREAREGKTPEQERLDKLRALSPEERIKALKLHDRRTARGRQAAIDSLKGLSADYDTEQLASLLEGADATQMAQLQQGIAQGSAFGYFNKDESKELLGAIKMAREQAKEKAAADEQVAARPAQNQYANNQQQQPAADGADADLGQETQTLRIEGTLEIPGLGEGQIAAGTGQAGFSVPV